jgi:hypothetical protein
MSDRHSGSRPKLRTATFNYSEYKRPQVYPQLWTILCVTGVRKGPFSCGWWRAEDRPQARVTPFARARRNTEPFIDTERASLVKFVSKSADIDSFPTDTWRQGGPTRAIHSSRTSGVRRPAACIRHLGSDVHIGLFLRLLLFLYSILAPRYNHWG